MSETDAILRSSLFPYFGGKGRVADVVWAAFDTNVLLYVEPFVGSGAVLFAVVVGHEPIDRATVGS